MTELKYYIVRRLLTFIPTIIGMLFLTFFVSHIVPTNAAKLWAGGGIRRVSEETLRAIAEKYHLNEPWWVQFYYYIIGIFTGDWGVSPITNREVIKDLMTYFPATAELAISSEILVALIGIPLGILSAIKKDSIIDHFTRVFALTGVSMPAFLLGIIMQYVFYYYLDILPPGGRGVRPVHVYTGLYVLDSVLSGDFNAFISNIQHLILPAFTLSFLGMGLIARITRSSMLEALGSDYVDYARVKGLPEKWVIYRHALKNALVPIVTVLGLQFGGMLSGAVITETIFFYPGVGRYAVRATYSMDYPAIMAVTFLFGLVYIVVNLAVDLAYAVIDPRVRL